MTISKLKLYTTHEHPCSYLPGRLATTVFIDPDADVNRSVYSELSDFGFRRSGQHIYKPHCQSCQACIAVRLPVATFRWRRTYRRTLQRNSDLQMRAVNSIDSDEHYRLYERYIEQRHSDGDMYPPSRDQFQEFLSAQWQSTQYLEFRVEATGQLLGVAVTDQLDQGLSAIYTFFEPDTAARSLGTYAILQQLLLAERNGLPYVYLGYWIKDCAKMRYKHAFRPLELYINHHWLTFD